MSYLYEVSHSTRNKFLTVLRIPSNLVLSGPVKPLRTFPTCPTGSLPETFYLRPLDLTVLRSTFRVGTRFRTVTLSRPAPTPYTSSDLTDLVPDELLPFSESSDLSTLIQPQFSTFREVRTDYLTSS